MTDTTFSTAAPVDPAEVITPSILYFGTPVVLLSTLNADGNTNLAPMSSAWALGTTVVLGLGAAGQSAHNLRHRPDAVINLPSPDLWVAVERLAPTTGRWPVPEHKQATFHHERDKFGAAGLTPEPSDTVRADRVRECPLQLETRAAEVTEIEDDEVVIVRVRVTRVHAHREIVVPGTSHVDPARWSPLIYNFRHYFGLGDELGKTFRAKY